MLRPGIVGLGSGTLSHKQTTIEETVATILSLLWSTSTFHRQNSTTVKLLQYEETWNKYRTELKIRPLKVIFSQYLI